MKAQAHFYWFLFVLTLFYFFQAVYDAFTWYFALGLAIAFFLINPDVDLIFGIQSHRSWFFHSALFPIAVYWGLHGYINMITAKEFGIILFFPMFVHLCCDFAAFWQDLQGSATISFGKKRLSSDWSKVYVLVNILGIMGYMVWAL